MGDWKAVFLCRGLIRLMMSLDLVNDFGCLAAGCN